MRRLYVVAATLIVLCLVAGVVIAQEGIERNITFWGTRVDLDFSSGMYPALRVEQDGTAPAFVVADSDGDWNVEIAGTGEITTTHDLNVTSGSIIGVPALELLALGTMTDGTASSKTAALMDDSPVGEWPAIDADVTATTSATIYKVGAGSLKLAIAATGDATDGVTDTGLTLDWTADESVGLWLYCTKAIASADLKLGITDSGAGQTLLAVPALSAADTWEWLEIDISGVTTASKDVITALTLELSAAGAAEAVDGAFDCYVDGMWKWDATEEEALGVNLMPGGVVSVLTVPTTPATANTPAVLVENTDYFIHYESGVDFIVTVTNQSAASGMALVAHQ